MKITTNKGNTYSAVYIGEMLRDGLRLLIDLNDERPLSEIAAEFEGLETITQTHELKPGIVTTYTGFTNLLEVHKNKAAGTVRVTLEKGDAA